MIDIYSLALCKVRGIGPATAKKLMEHYPSAKALFEESPEALRVLFGRKENTIEDILRRPMLSQCEKELEFIAKNNIRAYFIKDSDYPFRLKQIDSAPTCLFVKGGGVLDAERVVCIVGSRNASEYGKWVTANIVRELAKYNVCIISGLAYGIDSAAHICALNEGLPTFGVMGNGLDRVYPAQNYGLAQNMLANGGWVSEFFSQTASSSYNFPQRNRIIAALSDLCIVVEGSVKSGSMITPKYAREFNREVLAVPGRIGDMYSEGCNNLIASNIAASLSDISSIGELMGWNDMPKQESRQPIHLTQSPSRTTETPNRQKKTAKEFSSLQNKSAATPKPLPQMDEREKAIYELLSKNGKTSIDDIISLCSLDFSSASVALMTLELKGCIKALPGKSYEVAV